jgi:dTDP-4-dehydrorhamnose reductase
VYGASKAAAERIVLQFSTSLVIRLSLLFGPAHSGGNAFFDEMLIGLRERRSITLFEDEWRTPIDYTTAATAIVKAAESQVTGILHVGGRERLSRLEMGVRLARWIGAEKDTIQVVRRADLPAGEPRPRDVSLDSTRWRSLFADLPWPSYEEALRSNEPRTK